MTSSPDLTRGRRRLIVWSLAAVAVAGLVVAVVLSTTMRPDTADTTPTARGHAAAPTRPAAASPTPDTGFPENGQVYALDGLPRIDVFAIIPALPTDPASAAPTGATARAVADAIPVFADPTGQPVAALPRDDPYEGTTVAVVEQQAHWARVLLTGRAAAPSPGQLTGWVRTQDVVLGQTPQYLDVDLASGTVDIVGPDGVRERVAADIGYGADATPTPRGQTFIMLVRTEPSLTFTDGHPIVYLAAQSPALAGFDGADVAITAFHYYDQRSGPVSNGCLRLDAAAIDRLSLLPLGTLVLIH